MHTVPLKLVTIVAEVVLAERLPAELLALGAKGWTMVAAQGEGPRGRRTGVVAGENVQIEVVVTAAIADRILEALAQRYFPDFALVAWVSDVQVVRGEKYQ